MQNKIKAIAEYKGKDAQGRKAIEELSELLEALTHNDEKHIIEEIGDVEIMLRQLKYLHGIEKEVELSKQYKVDRELLRIEKENATQQYFIKIEDNITPLRTVVEDATENLKKINRAIRGEA